MSKSVVHPDTGVIDYEQAILLDAEELAEGGIQEAYERVSPLLRAYGVEAKPLVTDSFDGLNAYTILFDNATRMVYPMNCDESAAWGLATCTFFELINEQLEGLEVALYAINGGNDLLGVFITNEEADRARAALPVPEDWPYLPTPQAPWFGEFH